MMNNICVWEHYGGGRHIDAAWSPIFEDLYSLKLDFRIFVWPMCLLCVRLIRFFGCTHIFTVQLVSCLVLRVVGAFTIRKPLEMLR